VLSLFTPTHDPKHLEEAYDSLLVQDYEDWEWVLVPNGGMKQPVPARVTQDPRVRLVADPKTDKIGALKKHACDRCQGDAFIEFDHDDLLVPGTLAKIAKEIEGGAGFVYSDAAVFNDGSLKSWSYSPTHGWESYDLRVYEKPFRATKCFELTPRSLCEVYYAPDHVRVWSREAYEKTGGHNPDMGVADDHDLVCRTYLAGFAFAHIGCCGYLYRYHQNNTVKARSDDIARLQNANRQRYMAPLAEEWSRRQGLKVIELHELFRLGKWAPDKPIPCGDGEAGQVVAWDVLQFFPPGLQVAVFNEVYRVLAPAGIMNLAVPSSNGRYQDQDPRHRTRFNENSFLYYTVKDFARANPEVACKFQLVQVYDGFPSEEYKKHDMRVLFADLCALKGQRQPGRVHI